MRPLPSRNQKEPGYYQIVGNLISHRNPNLFKYIRLIAPEKDKNSDNRWQLNEEGVGYVASIIDAANSNVEIVNGLKIDEIDQKIVDFAKKHNLAGRPTTDQKMAKTILEINNYTCQFAVITGKSHKSFNSKDGNQYVEAHHLIPMKAAKDFFPRNLDRPSNIVCLCPICHGKLHHGDLDERKTFRKKEDDLKSPPRMLNYLPHSSSSSNHSRHLTSDWLWWDVRCCILFLLFKT